MTPENKILFDRIKTGALIVALLLLFFVGYKWRAAVDAYGGAQSYISSLNDTLVHLKNGVVQKPAIVINSHGFEDLMKERDDLKAQLSAAKIKAKNVTGFSTVSTGIDVGGKPIVAQLADSIPCPDFKPIPFSVDSQYYSISGKVGKGSVLFDTINFPDSLSVITAHRNHLFRKDEYVVLTKHSNPMVKTLGLEHFTITEDKKWWQSGWLKLGVGFAAGSWITYKLSR